jgi:hypothetical protein
MVAYIVIEDLDHLDITFTINALFTKITKHSFKVVNLYHDVSNISIVDSTIAGYRDMLLIDYNLPTSTSHTHSKDQI